MEMNKKECSERIRSVLNDAKITSNYLEDGKEIFAHRQLQGIRTKLINILKWLEEESQDVAQTNSKIE